ncbi:MAG TPA: hypothetical protein VLM80_09600 [Anaerolineales bacterium]|nr:hypothetical protein [Anaerolineales bacterium]
MKIPYKSTISMEICAHKDLWIEVYIKPKDNFKIENLITDISTLEDR